MDPERGWFLCCNNALRAANLRKYHPVSAREFFLLCPIYNVDLFFWIYFPFSRGWCSKGWLERASPEAGDRFKYFARVNDRSLLFCCCCFIILYYSDFLKKFCFEGISRRGIRTVSFEFFRVLE